MLFSKQTEKLLLFQTVLLTALYFIYIWGGYKSFNIWSQIDYIAGYNPLEILHHTHALRYLVVWPSIAIAEYFDWDRNTVFSYLVSINLTLCCIIVAYMQTVISKQYEKRILPWVYLFAPVFIVLAFPMNGRLSFMLLGTAIMMVSYTRWLKLAANEHAPWVKIIPCPFFIFTSLLLLSVSSGTFTAGMLVAIAQIFVFSVITKNKYRALCNIALNILMLSGFFYLQYLYIAKNLDFYDGSIFGMLTHGPGRILVSIDPNKYALATLFGALAGLGILVTHYFTEFMRKNIPLITPMLLICIAVAMGMLGYSILLTGCLATLLLTTHAITSMAANKQAPAIFIKHSIQNNFRLHTFSPSRKLASLLTALFLTIGLASVLPDSWKNYKTFTGPLQNQWILNWDKEYSSRLLGQLIPSKVTHDTAGNIYVVDNYTRIIRLSRKGRIEVLTGSLESGDQIGAAAEARFAHISDIMIDAYDNLYIADSANNKIKRLDKNGKVTIAAGNGMVGSLYNDCEAQLCRINHPKSVTVSPDGNIFISSDSRLLRVSKNGKTHPFLQVEELSGRKSPLSTEPEKNKVD